MLFDFSDQLFKKILIIYPKKFRIRFFEEMTEDFRELSREIYQKSGLKGFIILWLLAGIDVLKTAIEIHLRNIRIPFLIYSVYTGVITSFIAGASTILIAFTQASPHWIDWFYRIKWVWFLLGAASLLAIHGLVALHNLKNTTSKAGLYLSMLGTTMMAFTGPFMVDNIRVWRIFLIGMDLMAAGFLIEAVIKFRTKDSQWRIMLLVLGGTFLIADQLHPARHMGYLFNWDTTAFMTLAGISWIFYGVYLITDWRKERQIIGVWSVKDENQADVLNGSPDFNLVAGFVRWTNRKRDRFGYNRKRVDFSKKRW